MKYISTRGDNTEKNAASCIVKGMAEDRGLFVPMNIPTLNIDLRELKDLNYKDIAKIVLQSFLSDFTEEEITLAVERAYDEKFSKKEIVPVVKAGEGYFLELYHGKTSAFKDMALSILPYLMTIAMKKEKEKDKVCILTATSGDTGKAALEGFANVENTEIIVFYPDKGVSQIQERQMITQEGKNTHVVAIDGNFDNAQTGVKEIFQNKEINETLAQKGYKLSSANSINIGRLVPQIAYYVYGYADLLNKGVIKAGEEINVAVPTGNFGNILSAYYAKEMGIPIHRFICASNENNVLTDFINTGTYDTNRPFHLTNTPSMDILISSNLERLLYHLAEKNILIDQKDKRTETKAIDKNNGKLETNTTNENNENVKIDENIKTNKTNRTIQEISSAIVKNLMDDLQKNKKYQVPEEIQKGLKDFASGFATEQETQKEVQSVYENHQYLMDTHTAVAYKVYREYKEKTGDTKPTLIVSTASPYKFATSILTAFEMEAEDGFKDIKTLNEKTGVAIPPALEMLEQKEIRHKRKVSVDKMTDTVKKILT